MNSRTLRTSRAVFLLFLLSFAGALTLNAYDPQSSARSEYPQNETVRLSSQEIELLASSSTPLLILGTSANSFLKNFQQALTKLNGQGKEIRQLLDLCNYVVSGNRIIALDDYVSAVEYAQTLNVNKSAILQHITACSLTSENTQINNEQCDVYICHDAFSDQRAVKPFQTVTAALRPPVHKLCVGTLYITHRFCVEGPSVFLGPAFFKNNVCMDPTFTLSIHNICAKNANAAVRFCSNVCVDAPFTLSVNRIAPKTGEVLTISNDTTELSVEVGRNGGEVEISVGEDATGEVELCIGENCLAQVEFDVGEGAAGPVQVEIGEESLSSVKVCIGKEAAQGGILDVYLPGSLTPGVLIHGNQGICIDAALSLSVDKIFAKTTNGPIQICDDICIISGKKLIVESIEAKAGTGTQIMFNGIPFGPAPSDARIKEEINPMDPRESLKRITNLKPCTFKFSEAFAGTSLNEQEVKRGFLAQDVEKEIPQAVHTTPSRTVGDQTLENFRSLSQAEMLADVVGALQASHQELQDFKAFAQKEIDLLKARVAQLQK